MLPPLKNNAAAGYQGPVKTEPLKGAGLLVRGRAIQAPLCVKRLHQDDKYSKAVYLVFFSSLQYLE